MFKGIISAQKQLIREFKESWKFMLCLYIVFIIIHVVTGWSIDNIVTGWALLCVGLAMFALLWALISHFLDKIKHKKIKERKHD